MPLSRKEKHFSIQDNANNMSLRDRSDGEANPIFTGLPRRSKTHFSQRHYYMNRMPTISNTTIKRYNNPDTLIVVSPYPTRGETYSTGKTGVASYTKNVIKNMRRRVVVLCDIDDTPEWYIEDHILVIRCFRNKNADMWVDLARALRMFPEAKTVLAQYDFAMYGNPFVSSLGLVFLGFLRMLKYRTFVTLHHVVDDVMKLKGHVGLGSGPKDQFVGNIYNLLFHTFYRVLALVATQVIVLEASLKEKLETLAPWVTSASIPHGVDTNLKPIQTKLARKKLGIPARDHVIMFFGYINWFKGADIFARTFARVQKMLGKKVHIIIAGGESPTLASRHYYQDFFRDVRQVVRTSKHITLTGYVPQNDIATYFSAADLVVFPYRHYMTASGVLSLVFSYKKPFIISRPLAEMFHSEDFVRQLNDAGLKTSDITFDLYPQSIIDMTHDVLINGRKTKLATMATNLRTSRSYTKVAKTYEDIIFSPAISLSTRAVIRYT